MQDKNVKYLTNEKNESMKEKEFFIKKKKKLSVVRNYLRPESGALNTTCRYLD